MCAWNKGCCLSRLQTFSTTAAARRGAAPRPPFNSSAPSKRTRATELVSLLGHLSPAHCKNEALDEGRVSLFLQARLNHGNPVPMKWGGVVSWSGCGVCSSRLKCVLVAVECSVQSRLSFLFFFFFQPPIIVPTARLFLRFLCKEHGTLGADQTLNAESQ